MIPNSNYNLFQYVSGSDGHDDASECTVNTLAALAHEFEHGRAYINFHTDDGVHPQNTGPGDLFAPGEIRGDIGPGDDATTFTATIDASQQVLDGVDDTTPWDSVTSSGTVVFNTGHHSDHIDYTITADVSNVVGVHIHNGAPGENNHVHLVDIIPTDTDTRIDLNPGVPLTGEITVDDLCPGASTGHDDGHHDDGHDVIDADVSPDFVAVLNAEQAIPESDSLSTGTAAFRFNDDLTQLHYNILFSGLDLDGQQTVSNGHDDASECTVNTLAALAHEFEHGRAYINFHTDDGVHPQNTGPGDLFAPGEIRGDIGPGDDATTFTATIDASQQVLDGVDDTTPWDSVNATGTVMFSTGHDSDHIDYTITIDGLKNVVGVHIHNGAPGENNHVHLVDIIPTDTDTRIDLNPGVPLTGEITVDDLCPGASTGHDDGHHDDEFVNDGGNGVSDGHDVDDMLKMHIHLAAIGHTGPHALNIFGEPMEDDADMTFDAETGRITGVWGDDDENTELSESARSKKLSDMYEALCSEELYLNVHTLGFPSGAIRGQILPSAHSSICEPPSLVSGRAVSDNKIILEFDKPVKDDTLSFTSIEMPMGEFLTIDSTSIHHSSYGHGIVIIQTEESLRDITENGQFSIATLNDILGNSFDTGHNPLTLVNALGHVPLTLSRDSPNLILSDDSTLNEIIIESGVEAKLDLRNNPTTHVMGGKTTITIPSNLIIKVSQNTSDEVHVEFPAGLEITGDSDAFDGVINLPSVRQETGTDTCLPDFVESETQISSCIEIGLSDGELTLSQPAKMIFPNEGANTPYYGIGLNSQRILITDQCDAIDLPEVDGTEISSSGSIRECFIRDGNDMVIWFSHMTSFGTISSASSGGSSSGGSSSGGSSSGGGWRSSLMAPNLIMYNSCSEDLDGVVRILAVNKQGYDISAKLSNNDFTTQATDVTDDVSYLKYVDRSSSDYEYSIFDARFPNNLDSFWLRLYVTDDQMMGLSHLVKIPTDSCVGYEEPFKLKDSKASILKPIEPLETPIGNTDFLILNESLDATDPEPVMADPEPVMADPEPVMADPEPVMADPEPVMADPEPVMADPEPVMADPEPVMTDPEPVMADPEPVMADPEPVMVKTSKESSPISDDESTPKCGLGTEVINGICVVIKNTSLDMDAQTSQQTGVFEQFLKWLGLA